MSTLRPTRLASNLALLFALIGASLLASAPPALATHCDSCEVAVDSCCARMPQIIDPGLPPITRGVVETREPDLFSPWPFSVTLYDITQNIPPENTNWNPITRYHGPGGSWNDTNLGTVFGLTLDKFGNIYVTHTSCYSGDIVGPGGPGAIYRIDGTTGAITVFATLPNVADPNLSPPNDLPGLGNISYDCNKNQFFVTNMEDGRVYRLQSTNLNNASPATILNFFDPGAPDNGTPGFAPLGERLWGVQWHAGRVYYSVWATDIGSPPGTNSIRSVGLDVAGDYVWWSDRLELNVPSHVNSPGISSPVSDLSFGPTGKMLLAERTMFGPTIPSAHQSRVLEYQCEPVQGGGPWLPAFTFKPGQIGTQDNAAGGVDYDFGTYDGPSPPATAPPGLGGSSGRVWATSDAIHLGSPYTDVIYGLQAFRPTGGTITTSLLIDSDSNISTTDKTFIGDVEVPCPPPPTGRICGRKFLDSNRNGVRDVGEPPLAGWTITITGPVSQSAVTDQSGSYCFNNLPAGTYTVCEVTQPTWVQTAPPGGCYTVTLPPDALNLDFGNARCLDDPCLRPPTRMVSWWPLDEPAGTIAHDIMGPNPGVWASGGPIVVPGKVSNALQFNTVADFVQVNSSASLNFGTAGFSIDAWIKLSTAATGVRTIVDKRFQSGTMTAPAGYAFYVFNNKLGVQLADGTTFQNLGMAAPTMGVNTWYHVAAVFDRAANQVTMYVDGVPQTLATTVTGSVSNAGNLRIGQRQISPSIAFEGAIDEVEIFRKLLTQAEVTALYNADSLGKCKRFCQLPKVATYSGTQTSINVCFNICNNNWSGPMTFNWSLAGLPVGPGCTVAGPTVFSPASGTVTVPAGGCTPICVTIQRPAGLTPGQAACYQLTVMNQAGRCFSCTGTLRASNNIIFPNPASTHLVKVPSNGGTVPVSFTLTNGSAVAKAYDWAIHGQPDDGDPENQALRLNGLPPGTPVLGTLMLQPGTAGTVSVDVAYDPHLSIPLHQIVLSGDLDGDGILDEASAIGTEPGEVSLVGAPRDPADERAEKALGYPNPFSENTGVEFSLTRAQKVSVRVFDVNGRLVKTLKTGDLKSGRHYVTWDGLDDRGQGTGAGIFFLRIETADRTINSKVVRMK